MAECLQHVVILSAYSACSSLMLIVNKLAVQYMPIPSVVTLAQLVSCSIFCVILAHFQPSMVGRAEPSH